MEPRRADPFHRGDGFACDRARRHQAARHRDAVEQHGAGAADAGAADELRAGQPQRVAQQIDQHGVGIVGQGFNAAVDRGCSGGLTHRRPPSAAARDRRGGDLRSCAALAALARLRRRNGFGRRPGVDGAGDDQPDHLAEIVEGARVEAEIAEPPDCQPQTVREIERGHFPAQPEALRGQDAIDGLDMEPDIVLDEALSEVAGLKQPLGKQLLGLRRLLEALDDKAEASVDLRRENLRELVAGGFALAARFDFGAVGALVQRLDGRPKQRFLALEMMIDGLPRQPGLLGDLVHGSAPESELGEDFHGRFQNAFPRGHWTVLTNIADLSRTGFGGRRATRRGLLRDAGFGARIRKDAAGTAG